MREFDAGLTLLCRLERSVSLDSRAWQDGSQCRRSKAITIILAGRAADRFRQRAFGRTAYGKLALCRTVLADYQAGTPFGDIQRGLQMLNATPAAGGAQ